MLQLLFLDAFQNVILIALLHRLTFMRDSTKSLRDQTRGSTFVDVPKEYRRLDTKATKEPRDTIHMQPLVTILIPTYKRPTMLVEALESALKQDYANLEIIVCDDASTDETEEVVSRYLSDPRLRYFRASQNGGMVRTWKWGLEKLASGEWFLILSDDDYLTDPKFIWTAVAKAVADPGIRVVLAAGTVRIEGTRHSAVMQIPYADVEDGSTIFINRDSLIQPTEFILCGLLFHRATALAYQPFTDPNNFCCDAGVYFNICLRWKIAVIHQPVCVYREHGNNTLRSHKTWEQQLGILRMYFDLWTAAKESAHFTEEQLANWRSRVLLRACRTFILGARLYLRSGRKIRAAFDTINAYEEFKVAELLLSPVFLLKFLAAGFPRIYSRLAHLQLTRRIARYGS